MTDETVVEADGVQVTKSFDADGFPVPAVRFDVVSTRDGETTLTITDEIPDEFDIDQIGFHPEYGSEHWTATGDGIVRFERPIEANEEFTTVYGVRMGEDEEPSAFLDTPTVTIGAESETSGIEDIVPSESSDIVRELASGKRETIPGLGNDAGEPEAEANAETEANEPLLDALHEESSEIVDAEAVEAGVTVPDEGADTESAIGGETATELDDSEPTVAEIAAGGSAVDDALDSHEESESEPEPISGSTSAESVEEPEETVDERELDAADSDLEQSTASITAADVAAELAAQLRRGAVDDDDLDVLREEFAPKRATAQIGHLQTRVSEMEAYADALGAFIDENGDARGILEDLRADVEEMRSTIESLDASLETAETERADLYVGLENVEDELEGLDGVDERIDRVSGDVDALDDRVGGVEESASQVGALSDDIEDLRTEIREMKQWRDQLSDVFGG